MPKKKTEASRPPVKDETKEQRFRRVVSPRVARAVKGIQMIGACVGPSYAHTDSEVKQIEAVLSSAIATTIDKLRRDDNHYNGFSFDN